MDEDAFRKEQAATLAEETTNLGHVIAVIAYGRSEGLEDYKALAKEIFANCAQAIQGSWDNWYKFCKHQEKNDY